MLPHHLRGHSKLKNGKEIVIEGTESQHDRGKKYEFKALTSTGECLGTAYLLFSDGRQAEFEINVVPQHQRQGLGRKLFQNLVALARIQGISHMVHTPIQNMPSEFLQKLQQLRWVQYEVDSLARVVLTCNLQAGMSRHNNSHEK